MHEDVDLDKTMPGFFQSVLMVMYTRKSCITLIHMLVSIKRCEEAPRHFTTIIYDLILLNNFCISCVDERLTG